MDSLAKSLGVVNQFASSVFAMASPCPSSRPSATAHRVTNDVKLISLITPVVGFVITCIARDVALDTFPIGGASKSRLTFPRTRAPASSCSRASSRSPRARARGTRATTCVWLDAPNAPRRRRRRRRRRVTSDACARAYTRPCDNSKCSNTDHW